MVLPIHHHELNKPVFQAPWPKSLPVDVTKDKILFEKVALVVYHALYVLISLVFLPYGIYQVGKAGLKKLFSYAFFPSPLTASWEKNTRQEFRSVLKNYYGGQDISLKTPEGHHLDGMLFRGKEKKAVIYCVGWKSYFEFEKRFKIVHDIIKQTGDINLMLFNSRGVGESEGDPSSEGLKIDLYSTFKYLTDVEGIDPSNIVIYGHSLGGAYGAAGAELIQKEYPNARINLLSERSFNNYGENLQALFSKHLSGFPRVAKFVSESIVHWLDRCGWGVQAEDIPHSLKGKICIVYDKQDEAVPFSCSAYKKMKEQLTHKEKRPFQQSIRAIKLFEPEILPPNYSPHTRFLTAWEAHEIANEFKKMFGLGSEEPLNLRRVKEIGAEKLPEFQGNNKDCYLALNSIDRLYAYLEAAPDAEQPLINRLKTVFSCLETERSLFQHFKNQEAALKRTEDPRFISINPQGVKTFYLKVLARARACLLLQQLEENLRKNGDVQNDDRHLLELLEEGKEIFLDHQNANNQLVNPAHWLYNKTYENYERCRANGVLWPAPDSPEMGRSSFHHKKFFPNCIRLGAIQELQQALS